MESSSLIHTPAAPALGDGVIAYLPLGLTNPNESVFDGVSRAGMQIARIDGISGLVCDLHQTMGWPQAKRAQLKRLRKACDDKVLLADVGLVDKDTREHVVRLRGFGFDAVVLSIPDCLHAGKQPEQGQVFDTLENLALPCVIRISQKSLLNADLKHAVSGLVRRFERIVGVQLYCQENVLDYDEAYYFLKSLDRPLAVLPSCDGALFHNLNTGADAAISRLALVAPYELAELYRASQEHRFFDAQAIHNRLSPFINIARRAPVEERPELFLLAAHLNGTLAGPVPPGYEKDVVDNLRTVLCRMRLRELQCPNAITNLKP